MFSYKRSAFRPSSLKSDKTGSDDSSNVPFLPSSQQLEAARLFKTGKNLKLAAFAGTGKTSTLKLLAKEHSGRGLYLSFNSKTAKDAEQKFPPRVECRTTHSWALNEIASAFGSSQKLTEEPHVAQLAERFGSKPKDFGETLSLSPSQQAHITLKTIQAFCQSADPEIAPSHIPTYGAFAAQKADAIEAASEWILDHARRTWDEMCSPSSEFGLGHDGYLKLWALGQPKIEADYVLLDEAQDTNAVILDVLAKQNVQVVYVGDRHQQIYEWRGAVNAMAKIEAEQATLTRSWRFGTAIAGYATRILKTLGECQEVVPNGEISRVAPDGDARVLLARTNRTIIAEAMAGLDLGKRVHIVGGAASYTALLDDVRRLKSGRRASSSEFFWATTWSEAKRLSDTEEGEKSRAFVKLVETYGEDRLEAALRKTCPDEHRADLILSTAHRAKGREWDVVKIAPDFTSSSLSKDQREAEARARLYYVALTRARHRAIVDMEEATYFTEGRWKPKVGHSGR